MVGGVIPGNRRVLSNLIEQAAEGVKINVRGVRRLSLNKQRGRPVKYVLISAVVIIAHALFGISLAYAGVGYAYIAVKARGNDNLIAVKGIFYFRPCSFARLADKIYAVAALCFTGKIEVLVSPASIPAVSLKTDSDFSAVIVNAQNCAGSVSLNILIKITPVAAVVRSARSIDRIKRHFKK